MYRHTCLSEDLNALYYSGQNTTSVNYYSDQNHAQMANNLHTKGAASLNAWVVSGDVTASLDRDYASDHLSLSLTYENVLQGKTAVVDNPVITEEGILAAHGTPLEKREKCGDKFISAIHLGARFLINAKFIFRDEETKYHFKSDVTFRIAWKTFTENLIDSSFNAYKNDVAIAVTAIQFGGDEEAFDSFLKSLGPPPSCSIADLKSCQKYFQALLTYSQNDFLKQLADMRYSTEANRGPVPLFYDSSSYGRFGFEVLATNIDPKHPAIQYLHLAKDALLELQNRIDQEYEDNQRANQLMQHQKTFLLSAKQVADLEDVANKTRYNMTNLLLKAKENCLFAMQTCVQEKNSTFAKLITYNHDVLTPAKHKG